jgi:glycosyltransferase involved in cell wall biosynthesis
MRSLFLVVPGRLDTPTGGYLYDRHIAEGLRKRGWSVAIRELDESFPHPTSSALSHAAHVLRSLPDHAGVLIDGLALGAMPEVIEHEASRLRIAALVHLPLAADVSIEPGTALQLEAGERRALSAAATIIVTGTATLSMLARYGIARDKLAVVQPGTARAALARGSDGTVLQLLSVGTLNRIKGHEILLEALRMIPNENWHLTCAGSLERDPATVDLVHAALRRLELQERVTLVGELDSSALDGCYDRADLFVLATKQETYGMAVAEALAHGLPVVSTTTGAIPELVGVDAGLLAPPGNVEAFSGALARIIGDTELRARLSEGARRARGRLRSWDQACDEMMMALERLDNWQA